MGGGPLHFLLFSPSIMWRNQGPDVLSGVFFISVDQDPAIDQDPAVDQDPAEETVFTIWSWARMLATFATHVCAFFCYFLLQPKHESVWSDRAVTCPPRTCLCYLVPVCLLSEQENLPVCCYLCVSDFGFVAMEYLIQGGVWNLNTDLFFTRNLHKFSCSFWFLNLGSGAVFSCSFVGAGTEPVDRGRVSGGRGRSSWATRVFYL